MKYFHNIIISAFIKAEEDKLLIEESILSLIPFNLKERKLSMSDDSASSMQEKKITIVEVKITKDKDINEFMDSLCQSLTLEQKQLLLKQENRIDDDLRFYMRFDKESLIKKELKLTDSGNCIHLKFSVAAFPKKREAALAVIKKVFS